MGVGKLSIGTATDRVYLIGATGWFVGDWTPQAGDHLGTFAESALADYRAMKSYRDVTTTDTFTLTATKGSQDELVYITQELRRMLRKAIDYWTTDWQKEPVYIEAQADCETNPRYAIVHDARLAEDKNPYASPFMGAHATMEGLALPIEHGPWLANPPGERTCVQTEGTGTFSLAPVTVTGRPAESTDDAYAWVGSYTAVGILYFGNNGVVDGEVVLTTGIRFPAMAIPAGSRIISAYVTFVASNNDATTTVNLKIYGEAYDNAATYASWADFVNRTLTTASTSWTNVWAWVAGVSYNTPDITTVIQEIVSRPGWANGNAINIKLLDDGSTTAARRRAESWDSVVASRPTLTVTYGPPETWGRTATCNNEVYLSNKQNKANISNVHLYTAIGAVWGANLVGGTPYNLFPTVGGANNDAVYFGCSTALPNSGPFCSLVFDIGTAAAYAAVNSQIIWEYWNGAAWVLLPTVDNTADGPGPFSLTGVNSVHWEQPNNWATTDPDGAGVVTPTGWWVRARQAIGAGGSISIPTQQNRDVYSITWGSILIDDGQILGDIPALSEIQFHNPSATTASSTIPEQSDRLIMGLRAIERGENFSAFINLSNQQNPFGLQVAVNPGSHTTFVASPQAITGTWAVYNPVVVHVFTMEAYVTFSDALLTDYIGTYHAYLRCRQTAGSSGAMGARLEIYGTSASWNMRTISDTAYISVAGITELLDMGRIRIPNVAGRGNESFENTIIDIMLTCVNGAGGPTLVLYDLILIPVDEWAAEIIQPIKIGDMKGLSLELSQKYYLDLDGVRNPKRPDSFIKRTSDNHAQHAYSLHSNHWPLLFPNKSQRLWMVTATAHWNAISSLMDGRQSTPYTAHSLQSWINARYLSMRGNR